MLESNLDVTDLRNGYHVISEIRMSYHCFVIEPKTSDF